MCSSAITLIWVAVGQDGQHRTASKLPWKAHGQREWTGGQQKPRVFSVRASAYICVTFMYFLSCCPIAVEVTVNQGLWVGQQVECRTVVLSEANGRGR